MKMSEVFKLPMLSEDGDGYLYSNDLRYSIAFDDTDLNMMQQKSAVARAINMHDELVEALEQTAIELHNCIQAINQYKAKKVSSLDLDPPDYHDFQTVHESMLLVSKAKS